jgi:hypothetical protein
MIDQEEQNHNVSVDILHRNSLIEKNDIEN